MMKKVHLVSLAMMFSMVSATSVFANTQEQTTAAPITYKVMVPTSNKDKNGNTIEKSMAYVKYLQVKNGKLLISLDYIQWFMGDAAIKAYEEDHPKEKEEYMLEYYIRNSSAKIRTYPISSQASFILQTNTLLNENFLWNEAVNRTTFSKFALSKGIPNQLPFQIEVTNGVVTKITEQYIP